MIQRREMGVLGLPKRLVGLCAVILSVLLLGACNSSNDSSSTGAIENAASQDKQLTGTIEIDGSSTVFPLTEAVGEEFRKVAPRVQVNIGVSGTGGGFKRFLNGETAINDASRFIKDIEITTADANGIKYIAMKVGTDGLSVMVNKSNDFVECLTLDELKIIWDAGSTVGNWREVRADFPDRRINLYSPDPDSGTFDYFTEKVNGESRRQRSDVTMSADDNVLVQGIAGDRNALGYFGYGYYVENQDKLKLILIDSGAGCVAPSKETIMSGNYEPLARPLFIYVNQAAVSRPEVSAFLKFYMANAAELALEVGYLPEEPSTYTNNLKKAGI
jgi:phosphate transport system substrate-binding protein